MLHPIVYKNRVLHVLDQRLLPEQVVYHERSNVHEVYRSIKDMELRGAPLIGIAAAYGLAIHAHSSLASSLESFEEDMRQAADLLAQSRPTAVNLFWSMNRILRCLRENRESSLLELKETIEQEALRIHQEDRQICQSIGEHGLSLLKPKMGLLTHCNAGSLAVGGIGTATAPMYLGHQKGYHFRIFADETRPYLQGARLTAFELKKAGLDVTLICDNMAALVMASGQVNAVITGCDRVAANGDSANKIGTMNLAILAKHFGIPFYIAAPTPTIDPYTAKGTDIPIEERPSEELRMIHGRSISPQDVPIYNPAFDVTPHELISAMITEVGIWYPPFDEKIASLAEKTIHRDQE